MPKQKKTGYNVESKIWTGDRIVSLMFPSLRGSKSVSATQPSRKPKKTQEKGSPEPKKTIKPPKIGNYRDFVSKMLKGGERDFKVIAKEWHKQKGDSNNAEEK